MTATSRPHITIVTDASGRRHEIPDIWIAGFCQSAQRREEPSTVADAVNYWLYQDELERLSQ